MPQEIEAKFLNVNHDDVRAKLQEAGGECVHSMRLMRRRMFDYPDSRLRDAPIRKLLRLRDEGDKVTLTYKEDQPGSPHALEAETTVGSFDDTAQLLLAIGLEQYSVMEQKRETWHLDDCEVVLDEWPWVNPFIEIEGPSEDAIKAAATALGFDWAAAVIGGVDTVYRPQYPGMTQYDTVNGLAALQFDVPRPAVFDTWEQAPEATV